MGSRSDDKKQITMWVDSEEKDAFTALCKTLGSDVSSILRKYITHAVQAQSVEFQVVDPEQTPVASAGVAPEVLKAILKRLEKVERSVPKFDVDDLVRMRKEILEGEFGSMRYRMGIVESQVQSLGGNIVWDNGLTDSKERN